MNLESFSSSKKPEEERKLERMTSGEEVLQAEIAMRKERVDTKNERPGKLLRAATFLTLLAPMLVAYEQSASAGELAPGTKAGGVTVGATEGAVPLAPDTLNRDASPERAGGGVEVAPQSATETAKEYRDSQRFILDLNDPHNPENQKAIDAFNDLMKRLGK